MEGKERGGRAEREREKQRGRREMGRDRREREMEKEEETQVASRKEDLPASVDKGGRGHGLSLKGTGQIMTISVCTVSAGRLEENIHPRQMELQEGVSCLTWVLGDKLSPSA